MTPIPPPRFWPFRQSVRNGVLVTNKPPKFDPNQCERNLL
jgi:hypothetical protein